MKDEVLLEMMASLIQDMYDEGQGSEFRPAMQNVLVAFNNRGLTPRALDKGQICPTCNGLKYIRALKSQPDKQCPQCKGVGQI